MKRLINILLALVTLAGCHREVPMSVSMVRSEMARCPEARYLDFTEGRWSWNYTPGLEMRAMLDVYREYGGQDIFDYVEEWYDHMVQEQPEGGVHIEGYKMASYNLDKICPGKNLFYLHEETGKDKYRQAEDTLARQIATQPRTSDGGFWHKAIYPYQVWLDGLYMAEPFYVQYVSLYTPEEQKAEAYRDVVNDFLVAAEHCYDPVTGLYRHAWDETRSMPWADPLTGQSQHCWGRALGWYVMAIEEVLDYLPADTMAPERDRLTGILQGIYDVLPRYADPTTGLWYQVLDQPGREGNYLEATCNCMFAYAALKGVRLGYLDAGLKDWAVKTYDAVVKQFVRTDEQGLLNLDDCCQVGGLGGKQNRMGDFEYYLSEPVRSNDAKGVGPFIWASIEMERL